MYDYKQQCKEILKYCFIRSEGKDYYAILQIITAGNTAADYLTADEMQTCSADDHLRIIDELVERAGVK